MAATIDEIMSAVLELDPAVRALLAERLIESLDASAGSGLSLEWHEEIRRRCREIDQGTVQLRDAEAVFARAYAELT